MTLSFLFAARHTADLYFCSSSAWQSNGAFRSLDRSDLHPARSCRKCTADHQTTHILKQLLEHLRCTSFILYQWVTLSVCRESNRDPQGFNLREIFHPQLAERAQQQLTMNFIEDIFPNRVDQNCAVRLRDGCHWLPGAALPPNDSSRWPKIGKACGVLVQAGKLALTPRGAQSLLRGLKMIHNIFNHILRFAAIQQLRGQKNIGKAHEQLLNLLVCFLVKRGTRTLRKSQQQTQFPCIRVCRLALQQNIHVAFDLRIEAFKFAS